ncbi:MAG: response regulator [Bacteriovoracaceae bacterium]
MSIRVFYVDDEAELCELFEEAFSGPDVIIETFTSPLKALEKILENPPNLLFTDYRMPEISGVELGQQCPETLEKYLITGENNLVIDIKFEAIISKPMNSELVGKIILNKQNKQTV